MTDDDALAKHLARLSAFGSASPARGVAVRSVLRMILGDLQDRNEIVDELPSLRKLFPPPADLDDVGDQWEAILEQLAAVCK